MGDLNYKLIEIDGDPISVALEAEYWAALTEFCAREKISLKKLCNTVYANRGTTDLQDALRRFALDYNQAAANKNPKGMSDSPDLSSPAMLAALRAVTKH